MEVKQNRNDSIGLVSVVMTTFNVEKYIEKAIDSIINQTYLDIELVIVDDGSSDNTVKIIRSYNDPRIRLYRNKVNCGTYYSKNFAISKARGQFIAIHDSDDYSAASRIEEQAKVYLANPKLMLVRCQYCRVDEKGTQLSEPRAAFVGSLIRRKVFEKIGYYDSVRVAADDEFDSRVKLAFGWNSVYTIKKLLYFGLQREVSLTTTVKIGSDARTTYVDEYKKWHESVKDDPSKCYMPFPLEERLFPVDEKIEVPYSDTIDPSNNIVKLKTKGELITATVVTIPSRIDTFERVVDSIINQVDELRVYLNGVDEVPDYLNHPRIIVARSQDYGDLADNGKFFWSPNIKGHHFTIDDDIIYPANYVRTLLRKMEEYHYNVVVGVHGVIIDKKKFKRYYDPESRIVYSFPHRLKTDRYVHILGTGTVAFHSNNFVIDPKVLKEKRMVDIFVGIEGQKQNIPFVAISRDSDWLVEIETPVESRIYNSFSQNDDKQTSLIKGCEWNYNLAINDVRNNSYKSLRLQLNGDLLKMEKKIDELESIIQHRDTEISKKNEEIDWYKKELEKIIEWNKTEIEKVVKFYEEKQSSWIMRVNRLFTSKK